MRPAIVVVGDILPQNGAKMPLVDNDHVIQALSAECAYYSFGNGVRLGSPDRSEYRFDAQPSCPWIEAPSIAAVALLVASCPSVLMNLAVCARLDDTDVLRRVFSSRRKGLNMMHFVSPRWLSVLVASAFQNSLDLLFVCLSLFRHHVPPFSCGICFDPSLSLDIAMSVHLWVNEASRRDIRQSRTPGLYSRLE